MNDPIRLIHCQGGNAASARMATEAGWWYGFRSDDTHSAAELGPVALLDCDWVEPDWPRHLRVAAAVRPWLAVVPDVMTLACVPRALSQAEELATHCDRVMIVPKAEGVTGVLPKAVGGKRVVLGYSVPTGYGATSVPLSEFSGWPVHLLGGNPIRQADLMAKLWVLSADGNLSWRLARRGIVVTSCGFANHTIRQLDGRKWPHGNAHHEAFRRSLANLRRFWAWQAVPVEWRPPQSSSPSNSLVSTS